MFESVILFSHPHTIPFQSHLERSFGDVEILAVQDDALGAVEHRHADDGAAGEGHVVEVGVQGEVIAERMYALRQPVLCPWERFAARGQGVDWLEGSGAVVLTTTRLQRDDGSGSDRKKGITEKCFLKKGNNLTDQHNVLKDSCLVIYTWSQNQTETESVSFLPW